MNETRQTFNIGINIFVVKDGSLLLGKRKNIFGAGTWGLPGGHLEKGEAMGDAAARELMEETGLNADFFDFSNIVNYRGDSSYLQIGFVAHKVKGEPSLKEPDRCEEWKYFSFDNLPEEIFSPHIKQIENFLLKNRFADA